MLLQQDCMQHDDGSQSMVKVPFASSEETCSLLALTISTFNTPTQQVTAFKEPTLDTSTGQSTHETK